VKMFLCDKNDSFLKKRTIAILVLTVFTIFHSNILIEQFFFRASLSMNV
jgi:hypothetical protein